MIFIELETDFASSDLLKRAAQAALEHQSAPDGDVTIVLADDAHLQGLNRDYLGIDSPTDVLSFPASETDPETGARYIGDIVISLPYAAKGAKQAGNSLEAELQLLVVHGVLHLLGHDHAAPKEKTKMWETQQEILESLGLDKIQIREE